MVGHIGVQDELSNIYDSSTAPEGFDSWVAVVDVSYLLLGHTLRDTTVDVELRPPCTWAWSLEVGTSIIRGIVTRRGLRLPSWIDDIPSMTDGDAEDGSETHSVQHLDIENLGILYFPSVYCGKKVVPSQAGIASTRSGSCKPNDF